MRGNGSGAAVYHHRVLSRQDQPRRRAGRGWGLLAALLVLGTAACGDGGKAAPRGLPGAAEQLLTQSDVDRYPRPTPQHAVLQWWRDAQYSNVTGFVNAFQPSVRAKLRADSKTAAALEYFSSSIRTARPAIANVGIDDATATVYTEVKYRTPIGTSRYVTTSRPQAFVLVRRAARWLLQNDSFFQTGLPVRLRRSP